MLADSIPRYREPEFDAREDSPGEIMRSCTNSGICIRLVEILDNAYFDASSDMSWEEFAELAECADCTEVCP